MNKMKASLKYSAVREVLFGVLLLALLLAQGPLLRQPLDPLLSSFATLRAWIPPFLWDAAVAACLVCSGVIRLPERRDLSALGVLVLYALLLPCGRIPVLGGLYGGTSPSAETALALTPLFGVLCMLSVLRMVYGLLRGKGRVTFSLRNFAVHLALAGTAQCLPSLTVTLTSSPAVRAAYLLCVVAAAVTLIPYGKGARHGAIAVLAAGLIPALLAGLAFYTQAFQGTTLASLCALCLTPSAIPLYAAAALAGAHALWTERRV